MMNHNHTAYRPIQQTEDLDSFFHALAQTVKKLKPLTAAMLKKEFFNKVADAEIRELRELQESSDFVAHENGF